jgi:Protein of unknown function (DUF2971)
MGVTILTAELNPKRLDLLSELVPEAKVIAPRFAREGGGAATDRAFSDGSDARSAAGHRIRAAEFRYRTLAHYTSIDVLEKIMKTDEIWLSNPLFMNDLEEVRFGLQQGGRLFLQNEVVSEACGSPERAQLLKHAFSHYYNQFDKEHAFDTYVFCLSEHDPTNTDGLLSMWRGYGGQGSGAALVFNTRFVTEDNPASPLILTRVHYASADKRIEWLSNKLLQWCEILKNAAIPDDKLHIAAYLFFCR